MSNQANTQTDSAQIWAVVPAAGIGSRMATDIPKQYLEIDGRAVLAHTLDALANHRRIQGVVVAIRQNDSHWPALNYEHPKLAATVEGGQERIHSVLNALTWLMNSAESQPGDWVMVHDAARPCVSQYEIDALIDGAWATGSGALLSLPVSDTLKKVEQSTHQIVTTVDRDQYWRAQTPQMFPLETLHNALESALDKGHLATDESAAMEAMGFAPLVVQGRQSNIKITTADDLQLAKFYLGCAR